MAGVKYFRNGLSKQKGTDIKEALPKISLTGDKSG
jgi:hypothetical protein